jgi:DNA-binding transcriptional regulator YhcF (GntR family)
LPIYNLGPRAQRVYDQLRERITQGEFAPGVKLPAHTDLASEFGVAPLTVRQVLGRLEEERMVSRQQGRGTFVQAQIPPAVLILEDNAEMRALLRVHVTRAGYRAVTTAAPAEALAALESDSTIALIFSDVRVPTRQAGLDFIRTVRRRWSRIPLTAATGFPDDLSELLGTPDCPILILAKPIWAQQVEETLDLVLGRSRTR